MIFQTFENLSEVHCEPTAITWTYFEEEGKDANARMFDPSWRKGIKA